MNKGYLKKIIKYMKQVYHIEDALKGLTDTRAKSQYSTVEAVLPVLFGFLLRIQSFNELKYRLKSNDFKNIISKRMKFPQIDTIRDTHTIDVVVYDALACNSIWINHCLDQGIIPVVRVKDNNVKSIKEVKTKINKSAIKEEWHDTKRECVVKAYEESFNMDEVVKPLRFIKFSKNTLEGRYSQVLLVTTDFNIPLQTLYKMMHMRWDIENSIFNKLKTYCGLEHCFVHDMNAIEAILYLMSVAANLTQLFICRRIRSYFGKEFTQKEIIRLLEKELYLLTYDEKYIFNTG